MRAEHAAIGFAPLKRVVSSESQTFHPYSPKYRFPASFPPEVLLLVARALIQHTLFKPGDPKASPLASMYPFVLNLIQQHAKCINAIFLCVHVNTITNETIFSMQLQYSI